MARSENQKLKLLYLTDIFRMETDKEHPITMAQILTKLKQRGISAERRSIYDDMAVLESGYNFPIVQTPDRKSYYHDSHAITMNDLKTLVDIIQASDRFTLRRAKELVDKLKNLCPKGEGKELDRPMITTKYAKRMNASVYHKVNTIYEAIYADKQICFTYTNWYSIQNERGRHFGDKTTSILSFDPFLLVYHENHYFLLGYTEESTDPRLFKLDRMDRIKITSRVREHQALFHNLDRDVFIEKAFHVSPKAVSKIAIRFSAAILADVEEQFGDNLDLRTIDEDYYEAAVRVYNDGAFFSWALAQRDKLIVLSPAGTVRHMRGLLIATLAQYSSKENAKKSIAALLRLR